ncbi:MAG: hypothetical protein UIC64_07735 [Agathobacter sp.]|nr:hypothetical protein [Agathobacter sp.]
MGYRRPHHRRAHTRTNSDGSKSHVKECEVKGHNYDKKNQTSFYSGSDMNALDELLLTIAFVCFILFVLGLLLGWEDALTYFVLFLITLVFIWIRKIDFSA